MVVEIKPDSVAFLAWGNTDSEMKGEAMIFITDNTDPIAHWGSSAGGKSPGEGDCFNKRVNTSGSFECESTGKYIYLFFENESQSSSLTWNREINLK